MRKVAFCSGILSVSFNSVDTKTRAFGDLISLVVNIFMLIFFDYALLALLGSWPKEFLFGSKVSRFWGALGMETASVVRGHRDNRAKRTEMGCAVGGGRRQYNNVEHAR